jgi:hypothetical protein
VIQADGKGVPMVQPPPIPSPVRLGKGQKRTKTKEAVVTAHYTMALYHGTLQESDLRLRHKLFISIGEARVGADGSRDTGAGSKAEIVDDLRRLVDLGYRRVIVRYRGSDAEVQRQQLRLFLADIIQKV